MSHFDKHFRVDGALMLGNKDVYKFKGKRVLLRADFNVPMQNSSVTDDSRLRAVTPTIQLLQNAGARIIIISHMGRPKGQFVGELSLLPVRDEMEKLLGCEIPFAADCIREEARLISDGLQNGEVALLENLRFHKEEEANDMGFAQALANWGDIYVNDGFSVSHRAHASVEAITHLLPSYGGVFMSTDLMPMEFIEKNISIKSKGKSTMLVIGGSKISTKINTINNLISKLDYLVVGGGMANTFLSAQGYNVGNSLVENNCIKVSKHILSLANQHGVKVILPQDVVVADSLTGGANARYADIGDIKSNDMILDIGDKTINEIKLAFHSMASNGNAGIVIWNGSLGAFEHTPFGNGTFTCMRELHNLSIKGIGEFAITPGLASFVGGGDTSYALKLAIEQKYFSFGSLSQDCFTHVSLAGGAFLEYLEGKKLPGLEALKK